MATIGASDTVAASWTETGSPIAGSPWTAPSFYLALLVTPLLAVAILLILARRHAWRAIRAVMFRGPSTAGYSPLAWRRIHPPHIA